MTVIAPSSSGATDTQAGLDRAFSRIIVSPREADHHLTSHPVAVATYRRTINGWEPEFKVCQPGMMRLSDIRCDGPVHCVLIVMQSSS